MVGLYWQVRLFIMGQEMWLWYLSHRQPEKAQAILRENDKVKKLEKKERKINEEYIQTICIPSDHRENMQS